MMHSRFCFRFPTCFCFVFARCCFVSVSVFDASFLCPFSVLLFLFPFSLCFRSFLCPVLAYCFRFRFPFCLLRYVMNYLIDRCIPHRLSILICIVKIPFSFLSFFCFFLSPLL